MQANSPVYAVIGDPVAHSLSPAMHNRALAACGLPGVYVGFRVTDLPVAVAGIRALGIRGVSVTIPHKVAVMPLLDEIEARAVAWALSNAGAKVALFNRTVPRAAALARQMNLEWGRMDNLARWRAEILVNTTPVGMAPDAGAAPVAAAILDPAMVVMDIVYNPLETTLLAAARRLGCTTVDGVQMLVFQGAAQFERWTGVAAPVTVMRQAVIEALSPTLTHRHGQAAVF